MFDIKNDEKKVVASLVKLLTDEQRQLNRWRVVGRIMAILGWVFLTLMFMAAFQNEPIPAYFLFVSLAAGLCIGLSIWFSSFSSQWPILRDFIDTDRVNQRAKKFDV